MTARRVRYPRPKVAVQCVALLSQASWVGCQVLMPIIRVLDKHRIIPRAALASAFKIGRSGPVARNFHYKALHDNQ